MAIDDNNRLVRLFNDEEQGIILWYDKFERKLFVEDKNDFVKYLSDGSKYVPEIIPASNEILYSVAVNGVLSIKFAYPVDRKSLMNITVKDVQYSGQTSAKIIDFKEDDTLVLMSFQNADTMFVDGYVIDKSKNQFYFTKTVAWPIVYLLFNSKEELSKYWQFNQKKLTSIGDNQDVTEKEFNYDGLEEEKSGFDWLTEEWKTFYYDPTTNKSFDGDTKSLPFDLEKKWALCYLRQVPSGFKGETDGPHWYATYFIKNKETDRIEMTGWVPDITSYFKVEELQDSYNANKSIYMNYSEAMMDYKGSDFIKDGRYEANLYRKGDNWYLSGKEIQNGVILVLSEKKEELALTFKDYVLSEVVNLSSNSLLGESVAFRKLDYDSPGSKSAQDVISEGGIILTRGNVGGLYNVQKEGGWNSGLSPEGTEWNSNYTDSIGNYGWSDLSNVQSRKYSTFLNALDGSIGNNILYTELVMHDISQDQYWKFEFDSWTQGDAGGGFSYTRTLINV